MKKKKTVNKKSKPTRISKKETSHKDWLTGYWKWKETQEDDNTKNSRSTR